MGAITRRLFSSVSGINTQVDPTRIKYDSRKGIADLAYAVDVSIDDTGLISSRKGHGAVAQTGVFHSLFCDGGDAYIVQDRTSDAAVLQVGTDLSVSGVRSSLTKAARMAWVQVNDATFYANGHENGVIRSGTSGSWPVDSYNGPDSSEDFQAAPVGTHLGHRNGIMGIAVGNVVWFNHLPYVFGLFNLKSGFVQFETDVRMVKPVAGGWFISDSKTTWFFQGDHPRNFVQVRAATYPAIEWGEAIDCPMARDIGIDANGVAAIWASEQGVCAGLADGSLVNMTTAKLDMPVATVAASLVYDKSNVLVTTV